MTNFTLIKNFASLTHFVHFEKWKNWREVTQINVIVKCKIKTEMKNSSKINWKNLKKNTKPKHKHLQVSWRSVLFSETREELEKSTLFIGFSTRKV